MFCIVDILVSEVTRRKLFWRIINYTIGLGILRIAKTKYLSKKKVMEVNKYVEAVNTWLVTYIKKPTHAVY
jgi:hypothetical protein